ncbi:hypothetical protein HYV11_03995 [Candidatus Dependentiae bacterium]|nr:hypothetical protein [Candidatus Dependentiae bacterium]
MKKIIYEKILQYRYQPINNLTKQNRTLTFIINSFDHFYDFIIIDGTDDHIYMWNDFDKEKYTKENLPILKMSYKNYTDIINQWDTNLANPAPYLVLTQDEDGFVNLESKQTLSQEDLDFIASEKLKLEQDKTISDVFKNNINND